MHKNNIDNQGFKVSKKADGSTIISLWQNVYEFPVSNILFPTSIEEIQHIIQDAANNNTKVKVIGAGHSMTPVAMVDDGGILISLVKMDRILSLTSNTITVEGGCPLGKITQYLKQNNKQLCAGTAYGMYHAGAFSGTQLHDSSNNPNRPATTFASHAIAYKIINSKGEVEEIANDLEFWRIHLGHGGVVVAITFKIISLEYRTTQYDFISWEKFWPQRELLLAQYDEVTTIYYPIVDMFSMEKIKCIEKPADTIKNKLNQKITVFIQNTFFAYVYLHIYYYVSNFKSLSMVKAVTKMLLNNPLLTKIKFLSTGGDRAAAYHPEKRTLFNDYLFDKKDYMNAMFEFRDFLQKNINVGGRILVFTFAVCQDKSSILSRSYNADGFTIEPVVHFKMYSDEQMLIDAEIKRLAIKYKARPHLNKVFNIESKNIKAGYEQDKLRAYIDWCNKMDPTGMFQGKFYRTLKDSVE